MVLCFLRVAKIFFLFLLTKVEMDCEHTSKFSQVLFLQIQVILNKIIPITVQIRNGFGDEFY